MAGVEFHDSVRVDDLGFDLESVVIRAQGFDRGGAGEARLLSRHEHARAHVTCVMLAHKLPDAGLEGQRRFEFALLVQQPRMRGVLEEGSALMGDEVDSLAELLLGSVRIADHSHTLPGPDEPGQGDELGVDRGV